MAQRKWYIQYNDSILGPFTSSQLRKMAERSQITPDVKVRVGEDGDWRMASSVKGLVINGTSTSDSMSSELSSEDILSPESNNDSNSSSELSSEFSETSAEQQDKESSSSSFGEMPSVAPPLPGEVPPHGEVPIHGEVPPRGEIPVHGKVPPPFTPGEMPSPPPPIDGAGLGWSLSSSGRTNRKTHSFDAVPHLIQTLISSDEQILYAAHPAYIVLFLQFGLTLMLYLFLGLIPTGMIIANVSSGLGSFYLFCSTLCLLCALAVHYLRWVRSSYVITTERTFVKSGIFSVDVAYIYNANIQMLKIRTGVIDKILHLNSIELRTSAGFITLRWIPLTEVLKFYR